MRWFLDEKRKLFYHICLKIGRGRKHEDHFWSKGVAIDI